MKKKRNAVIFVILLAAIVLLTMHFMSSSEKPAVTPDETKTDAVTTATSAPNFGIKPVKAGDDLTEVSAFLLKHRMGFLATIDNGKPRVRAFGLMKLSGGTLYFSTSHKKDIFAQLSDVPFAEWICMNPDSMSTLRVLGKVEFVQNSAVKQNVIDENPMIKKMYAERMDELEIFTLELIEANWFRFGGPPPKK